MRALAREVPQLQTCNFDAPAAVHRAVHELLLLSNRRRHTAATAALRKFLRKRP
jgi:hypothetical protein